MKGLMQDEPLTLVQLFRRAEQLFGAKGVTTATPRAASARPTPSGLTGRGGSRGVLDILGISDHGRVGTFAWNSGRHLELYFAAPCSGRVLHTLNIRLFPDQLTYIANHAEDEVIFVDRSLAGLLWPLLPTFTTVKHLVVMDDGKGEVPRDASGITVHDYEGLLCQARPAQLDVRDENQAASMCYTSGTTGNPKGVVYSHRSSFLHAVAAMTVDSIGVREADRILPVVPMFHANAWGLAQAAVGAGADLVMPGADLSPKAIADLIVDEHVTVAAGVPTIWMGTLPELSGRDTSSLRAIALRRFGRAQGAVRGVPRRHRAPDPAGLGHDRDQPDRLDRCTRSRRCWAARPDELADVRAAQGLMSVCVELRIVEPGSTEALPWDGETSGELQAKGPWIARSYYNDDRSAESFTEDGWLRTGDVATIDAEGYIRLVDRTKDLIKSGGEWISSVELENELMAHPKIAEAAVIGVPHPKWSERPLACVVVDRGQQMTKEEVLDYLSAKVAKWQLPDDVVFIDEVPKTSVGKFSKKDLRARFADYVLPT